MTATVSETLADAILRRAVQTASYARGQSRLAMGIVGNEGRFLLPSIQADLVGIKWRGPSASPTALVRFTSIQGAIDESAQGMADTLRTRLAENLRALAKQEADWQVRAAAKAGTEMTPLDKRTVGGILSEPMAGRTLDEWTQSVGDALARRIKTELSIGLGQGESDQQLQGRVTRAFEEAKRNAAAVAATGVRHVSTQVRQRQAEQNGDKIRGLMWVATLETTTCVICWSRHGRVWLIDRGPRPPAHPHCACVTIPVLAGEPDPEVADADDWLRAQGNDFQDETLGPRRARLWRDGDIGGVRDLTNMRGRPLTLDELAARA